MLFSLFLLGRLSLLEKAARGYGDRISEKALYEALGCDLPATEDFAVLIEWGLTTGMLIESPAIVGRQFRIDRRVLPLLRRRANGESIAEEPPVAPQAPIQPRRQGRTDLGR